MTVSVDTTERSPLRIPAFRSLWAAGLVSETGDWLMFIALPVVVFRLTGSAFGTAATFLAELVPGMVLAPLAGRLADRLDRRRLLVTISLLQALVLTGLLLVRERHDLPVLYAVVVVEAALLTMFEPARAALVPALVGEQELVRANALSGLATNLARLVGGPLGGVAVAAGGLRLVAVCDLVTYLLAAVLLAVGVRSSASPAHPGRLASPASQLDRVAADAADRTARPTGRIAPELVVWSLAGIAQGIFVGAYVVFVERRLGGGAGEVGLLRGIQAVGSIVAGVIAATALRWVAPTKLLVVSAVVFGLLDLGLWNLSLVTTATAAYVVLFAAVGAPGVLLSVGLVSRLQAVAPASGLGRAFAYAQLVTNAGQAVGLVAAGFAGDAAFAPWALLGLLEVQGVLYLLLGLVAGLCARRGEVGWRSEAVRG